MSEELARLAAQQEAIRRMIQNYQQEILNKDGNASKQLNDAIEKMEQTEKDLVNKRLTQEMINRQKEILVRLLEAEKAQQERGYEKKRKSNEAKNEFYSNPKGFFEYKNIKDGEEELLKTIPPTLKPYYKSKVNKYFYNFE
ncbi:MAG: hypothetical protein CVT98_11175 [Bacteroidetes bacterium HGW-Bacteroidetes-15]|nr:MAG: hypothetical protein CVT98_11175 [Bacteroidetes bacterium HGW-Bacteroidetes-15]